MVADHTVRVRQRAVDHGATLDEALHVDVEQFEVHQARGVDVVLERSTVVRGAPRIEGWITVRAARRNLVDRTRLGFLQRVVQRQASAPLAQVEGHHVLGIREAHGELTGHIQREVDRRQDVVVAALDALGTGRGRLGDILTRKAGLILGNVKIGVDQAHTHVTAVPHAAEIPVEIGLHIARQLLLPYGPTGFRRSLCRGIGIKRLPVRHGIIQGVRVDRPEGDPRAQQVGVFLKVVGEGPGAIQHLQRRQLAGTEGAE